MFFERTEHYEEEALAEDPQQIYPLSNSFPIINQILSNSGTSTGKAVFVINTGKHTYNANQLGASLNVLLRYALIFANQGHLIFFRETAAEHFKTTSKTGQFPQDDPNFDLEFDTVLRQQIHRNSTKLISDALILEKMMKRENSLNTGVSTTNTVVGSSGGRFSILSSMEHKVNQNHALLKRIIEVGYSCENPQLINQQQWRHSVLVNKLQDSIVMKNSNNLFKILPFWNITAGRFDAHSRTMNDCSHYCNNPMIWLPVWDTLARAILAQQQR